VNRYLLDSNHLSAYLDRQPVLAQKVKAALRAGDCFGICLPVLCEYRAGIRLGQRFNKI
jgi:predicted nucleic acid-binding protein